MCHPRAAFTLIELLIAIALGMVVVYTAVAGVRVAAQSITVAQRMSTENAIIRTGFSIALEEKDFWLGYDDPANLAQQPFREILKSEGGKMRGLPFTRFKDATAVYPRSDGTVMVGAVKFKSAADDGWDPVHGWKAADPNSWAWGNLIEQTGGDSRQIFGRYHDYARADGASPWGWQQRQLEGLKNTMGYWGLFDYMPANTPLMVYAGGKVANEWCQSNDNASFYMANGDGGANYAQCLYRRSKDHNFIFPSPAFVSPAPLTVRQKSCHKYYTGQGAGGAATGVKNLRRDATLNRSWLNDNTKPIHWPSLDVGTLRFINHGRFVCLNTVRWSNPITGQSAELSFTSFGTTLRGARQQRHRDEPRWADFELAEPHLDSY
jgi:hypothetical protein